MSSSSKPKIDYEEVLANMLDDEGIAYEQQYAFAAPHRKWRSDFYVPRYRLLIEVDGILYKGYGGHQTGAGMQGDLYKLNHAITMGYTVLRFTPAMVMGTAKENLKGQPKMEKAIDTIKRYISNYESNFRCPDLTT